MTQLPSSFRVYGEGSREYRSQGSGGERMILQALKEYYDRKAADPDSDIAPKVSKKNYIF